MDFVLAAGGVVLGLAAIVALQRIRVYRERYESHAVVRRELRRVMDGQPSAGAARTRP